MELDIIRRVIEEMRFKIEREVPNTRLDVENYIVIVEALEKQIPKVAIENQELTNVEYICPKCDCISDRSFKYCSSCGQSLTYL